MQAIKEQVKSRLFHTLRQKFSAYQPETSYMPFHTRLLGKDRMALYSFIQSLNTNFGTSIFEPVAEELAKARFDTIKKQSSVGGNISKDAQSVIQDIMNALESGAQKPNKDAEIAQILAKARSGDECVF